MQTPPLYLQLSDQLCQLIKPKDQRHLKGFTEIIGAILHSGSGCLSRWIPFLSHRDCTARSHMERLNYFIYNPRITAETFYNPLLKEFLQHFIGTSVELTLDTSVL